MHDERVDTGCGATTNRRLDRGKFRVEDKRIDCDIPFAAVVMEVLKSALEFVVTKVRRPCARAPSFKAEVHRVGACFHGGFEGFAVAGGGEHFGHLGSIVTHGAALAQIARGASLLPSVR